MQESQNWNSQFNQFQGFTEKLNTEAIELKTKLEKERREAKRLSNVVHESKQAQEELSRKLQQAEESHNEAMKELKEIEEIKKELQDQRDIMFNELLKIASITNNSTEESNEILDEIYDKIEMKIETLSTRSSLTATSPSHTHTMPRSPSRSSMTLLRTASKASMRSEKAASRGPVSPSRSGSTYKRSRKTSVTSNGTIRTLTELAEEEAEHGHDVGEHAKNGNDRLLQEGDDEEEGDIEEDDYLEMAAMRRMVSEELMFNCLLKSETWTQPNPFLLAIRPSPKLCDLFKKDYKSLWRQHKHGHLA